MFIIRASFTYVTILLQYFGKQVHTHTFQEPDVLRDASLDEYFTSLACPM